LEGLLKHLLLMLTRDLLQQDNTHNNLYIGNTKMVSIHQATITSNDEATKWYEKAGNFMAYSAPSVIASAGVSFVNTGVNLANTLGGDFDSVDTGELLDRYIGTNAGNYYRDNQKAMDLAGFVAGSIVPGGLAVKGLRAFQKGRMAARGLTTAQSNTNIFNPTLNKLISNIRRTGQTDLPRLERVKLLGQGLRQQAYEAAVYEAATLATMANSSLFNTDDLNYFEAIGARGGDFVTGVVAGGLIGGGLQYVGDTGAFRAAARAYERKFENPLKYVSRASIRGNDRNQSALEAILPGSSITGVLFDLNKPNGIVDTYFNKLNTPEFASNIGLRTTLENSYTSAITDVLHDLNRLTDGDAMHAQQMLRSMFPSKSNIGKYTDRIDDLDFKKMNPDAYGLLTGAVSAKPTIADEAFNNLARGDNLSLERLYALPEFSVAEVIDNFGAVLPKNASQNMIRNAGKNYTNLDKPMVDSVISNSVGTLSKLKLGLQGGLAENKAISTIGESKINQAFNAVLTFGDDSNIREMLSAGLAGRYGEKLRVRAKDIESVVHRYKPELKKAAMDLDNFRLRNIDDATPEQLASFAKIEQDYTNAITSPQIVFDALANSKFRKGFDTPKSLRSITDNPMFTNARLQSRQFFDTRVGKVVDEVNPSIWDIPHSGKAGSGPDTLVARNKYARKVAKGLLEPIKKGKLVDHKRFTSIEYSALNHDVMYKSSLKYNNVKNSTLFESLDKDYFQTGYGDIGIDGLITRMREIAPDSFEPVTINLSTLAGTLGKKKAKQVTISSLEEAIELRNDLKLARLLQLKDSGLNADQLAIRLNVDPEGIAQATLKNPVTTFLDNFGANDKFGVYQSLDTTTARHLDITYSREGVIPEATAEAIAIVQRQVAAAQHIVDDSVAKVLGPDFADQLADNMRESGVNFAARATSQDTASGFVTTTQAELGKISQFTVPIGKTAEQTIMKGRKEITELLQGAAKGVMDDPKSLAEISVLEQKMRSHSYALSDSMHPKLKEAIDLAAGTKLSQSPHMVSRELLHLSDELAQAYPASAIDNFTPDQLREMGDAAKELADKAKRLIDDPNSIIDHTVGLNNTKVSTFLTLQRNANTKYVTDGINSINFATGNMSQNLDGRILYPGKYQTERFKHFYIVEDISGDTLWGNKSKGFITAPNAASLEEKRRALESSVGAGKVVFKSRDQSNRLLTELKQYENSLDFTDVYVDAAQASGKNLFDLMPEPNKDSVLQMVNSVVASHSKVVRNAVKAKYSTEIDTLRQYSASYQSAHSMFGAKSGPKDPFAQQINTMLNISNSDDYSNWLSVQENIDEWVSKAAYGIVGGVKKALAAREGTKANQAWKALDSELAQKGFPRIYSSPEVNSFIVANSAAPQKVLQNTVAMLNGVFATLMLRLDTAQAAVNVMSTPIMQLPEMKALTKYLDDDVLSAINSNLQVKLPNGKTMPSNLKLMMQSVKDYFGEGSAELIDRYKSYGILNDTMKELRQSMDAVNITADNLKDVTGWRRKLQKAADWASTPTDKSEQFTKFIAARSADKIIEHANKLGAKISDKERISLLKGFTSKVAGNYTASQRPAMFQGFAGQAIGLFQTYQFNLMQRALSHVANAQNANLKTMLAAQVSIFGAQSVPGFNLLNEYILSNTMGESDFYSESTNLGDVPIFGDTGELLMFGFGSNFVKPVLGGQGIDFFNRGNLNPRSPIIIPSSLDEIPVVGFAMRLVENSANIMNKLGNGAPVGETLWQGMAHNGFNRPLQGLAQLMLGHRTTRQGGTIVSYEAFPFGKTIPDMIQWQGFANSVAKLMGTQTMDEAIAINTYYRHLNFQSARQADINSYGQAVRDRIRAQDGRLGAQDIENVVAGYISKGGRPDTFNRWLSNNYSNANESLINQTMYSQSQGSRYLWNVLESPVRDYTTPQNTGGAGNMDNMVQ
jgi:hypothetical protein